ncbi:right-handed parallel beta-helix repeat-containing protein [Brucella sp. NBRC 113783]|uniref:right-handed parallel beta-helix repeat-containing protein n=1 Tax=Brucella sp. NBRC 113783 TaxID=3075478 RepID=UPI0029C06CA1|nr:right-handed parallel beta-helix repeat-containing protein [Brucella sp. NBRC 113783]MDX4074807.1 right-handed parallel beta-helix repeat-containing protein [Brucella sp. NBRC 113783]
MNDGREETRGSAPTFPKIDEREWYALAIASACVTAVLAGFLLFWVFYGIFPTQVSERISIAGAIIAFGGAATTFFTVAWRGLINARQADTANAQIREAVEQGRRVDKQLVATDTNNLTSQFAQAAEMLADSSKAKQRAAIGLLRHVGLSPAGDFRQEALDLLLDYLRNDDFTPHTGRAPLTALQYADEIALSIRTKPFCRAVFDDAEITYLPKIIRGAVFKNSQIMTINVGPLSRFDNCKFYGCTVDASRNFIGRTFFHDCRIQKINVRPEDTVTFVNCDFSDCERAAGVTPEMLDECYYREGAPPVKRVYAVLGDTLWESDAEG